MSKIKNACDSEKIAIIKRAQANAQALCRATDTTTDDWSDVNDNDVFFDVASVEVAPELETGVFYECKLVGACRQHDKSIVIENDYERRSTEIRELYQAFYFRELGKKSDTYTMKFTCWKGWDGKFRLPENFKALRKALDANNKNGFVGKFLSEEYEYENSEGKIRKGRNITLVEVAPLDQDSAERI